MTVPLSLHNADRVLVVGTTSDYIDRIRNVRSKQVIFLTDKKVRGAAKDQTPADSEEILWDLADDTGIKTAVDAHMAKWRLNICGVACFDCESMETTAKLAADYNLPYPGIEAVRISRDKYVSKEIWHQNGIACPIAIPIKEKGDVIRFLGQCPDGVVLKPFCGSGSELVFLCRTPAECEAGFETIDAGLAARTHNAIFDTFFSEGSRMVAEQWINGPEFSCDFVLDRDKTTILRTTQKIKMGHQPFGTASAYALSRRPDGENAKIADMFQKAAAALGIQSGICMVDFIVQDGLPMLIEMTPRPGGDCLPYLLEKAAGLDILGLTIDLAAQRSVNLSSHISYEPLIGFRLHAHRNGILKGFNAQAFANEKNVRQLHIIRQPGHVITMPPDDYDSWLLGHVLFLPDGQDHPTNQCERLANRLQVKIQ